jgi:GNAT superfamily N-acetyltransferase
VQVAAWEAAYRGLIPDDVIDGRTVEVRASQWKASLGQPDRLTLVACNERGSVEGFASALILDCPDRGFQSYLQTLYVLPGCWRTGIGRHLLFEICARLQAAGIENMALRTMRLGAARAFYERFGARLVPEGIVRDAGRFDDVVYAFNDLSALPARYS